MYDKKKLEQFCPEQFVFIQMVIHIHTYIHMHYVSVHIIQMNSAHICVNVMFSTFVWLLIPEQAGPRKWGRLWCFCMQGCYINFCAILSVTLHQPQMKWLFMQFAQYVAGVQSSAIVEEVCIAISGYCMSCVDLLGSIGHTDKLQQSPSVVASCTC